MVEQTTSIGVALNPLMQEQTRVYGGYAKTLG